MTKVVISSDQIRTLRTTLPLIKAAIDRRDTTQFSLVRFFASFLLNLTCFYMWLLF